MNKFVTGVIIVVFAATERALAADDVMVTKAPAIPSSAAPPMTGAGSMPAAISAYACGSSNWTATPGTGRASGSIDLFQSIDTFRGTGSYLPGLQAGYNYMLPNVLSSAPRPTCRSRLSQRRIPLAAPRQLPRRARRAELSARRCSSGTVRGRVGYAPGNWLFYATGGFAWSYDQLTLHPTRQPARPKRRSCGASAWRAGAGVEAPVAPHWTARLEYLFTDYGNSSVTFWAAPSASIPISRSGAARRA